MEILTDNEKKILFNDLKDHKRLIRNGIVEITIYEKELLYLLELLQKQKEVFFWKIIIKSDVKTVYSQ